MLPDSAGLERPLNDANRQATADFLNWVGDVLQWGRGLAQATEDRAASKECSR